MTHAESKALKTDKLQRIEDKAWKYLYETGNGYSSKKMNGSVMSRLRLEWELEVERIQSENGIQVKASNWYYTLGDSLA
jgi:hypothetical protein